MIKRISRQTKSTKTPIFVLLAMILIVIGVLVTIFSFFMIEDLNNQNTMQFFEDETSSASSVSEAEADISSDATIEQSPAGPDEFIPIDYTLVPDSQAVEKSYFDDAVFIGDSTSIYFRNFSILPPANVIAEKSVHINNIANNKPVYSSGGTMITLPQALAKLKITPTKIYILLGMNSIPWLSNVDHIGYYETVIDQLIVTYPDALIYVQSVTPITQKAERRDFTNKKINEFNDMIFKLAEKKNIFYLNVKEVLADKNGYLSSEFIASKGSDGIHFHKNGHEALYEYYTTHTAPYKKQS